MAKTKPEAALPNRIRAHRKLAGFTLKELAEHTGIHFTNIGEMERGLQPVKNWQLETIARALHVKPADLLSQEDGGLTPEERELIDTYREIPAPLRRNFDALRESHQPFRGQGDVVPFEDKEGARRKA